MNSIAGTPENQEDGSSKGRRKFMKMLGFAAGASAATTVAVLPAAAAPVANVEPAHPFGERESRTDMKLDYDRHMLAHVCLVAELMREWYKANEDGIRQACPQYEGAFYDFMFEQRASARAVAKAAGIELDQAYIASRAAEFRARATGDAA